MKKFREFMLLFVPFVVLTVLPVVVFITRGTDSAFLSNEQYLRLLLKDGLFWSAIFNTYCIAMVFSVFTGICAALACHFIKPIKSRKVFYPVSIILASIASFCCIYTNQVTYLGLPEEMYNTQSILTNTPPSISVSISIYDILLSLQLGFFATLLFWLLEMLIVFIKTRRKDEEKLHGRR